MKKNIISYWDSYYNKKIKFKESSFARSVFKYIGKSKNKKLIDIGCGNGRDSIFFSKRIFCYGYRYIQYSNNKKIQL